MALALKSDQLREKQRQRTAFLIAVLLALLILAGLYFVRIYFGHNQKEIEFGMEVTAGTDAYGSNSKNIPIETVSQTNNDETKPSETPTENTETIETITESETEITTNKKKENSNKDKQKDTPNQKQNKNKGKDDKSKQDTGKGNDKDKPGNKGKENGVNKEGIYDGSGGSGGDSPLSLSGWKWENEPKLQDTNTNVTGTILFQIEVDDEGEIVILRTLYPGTTVANKSVVEKYRQAILQSYLIPTKEGAEYPPRSKGFIKYVLKSK